MPDLSLSLCMIVKNEEHNLERCLASVQGLVDEIILVDTGSSDRTLEIAKAHGAKIFYHTWQENFSLARNISLEPASGDWILYLDADEELEIATRPLIKALLNTTEADAITVRVRNFNPPGDYFEYQDSWQVRLWRNRPQYRFEQSVHNQIAPAIWRGGGKIIQDDTLTWLHYGYMERGVQGTDDRYQRSLKMLEQAVARSPQSAYLNAKLGILYYLLGNYPLAYAYLKRLFTELDASQIGIESLTEAMITLALVALNQQHYDLVIRCTQACIELAAENPNTLLYAKGLLARGYAEQGKHYLQAAEQNLAKCGDDVQIMAGFRPDHLQQGLQFLREARQQYQQLQQQPGLKPEMSDKVTADLNLCQEMIAGVEDFLTRQIGAV